MRVILFLLAISIVMNSCEDNGDSSEVRTEQRTDKNGFAYETVSNDPTGLRLYTLDNGLQVYLSKNDDEPKIQTNIAVRAGSTYDPADNTGLAHYLEHMLFKGNDKIGTQDWEAEQALLEQISDLYEQHKAEADPDKKKEIYQTIDSLSQEASKVSIANEYGKMLKSLGAEGTNAWTWHEETVYTNKIPSNELDKWLMVESERFSKLVLRLFHTELEAVYEEFNRAQDNDFRKEYYALSRTLFPTHPYGQQPTIGLAEHLKNPSMEAIHAYFSMFYVPNNMAVILVGDIDYDETIQKVNDAFGGFEARELTHPERPEEDALTAVEEVEVFGPEAERVNIAFRTPAIGTDEAKYVTLISQILYNRTAGLIDLNLVQDQKVQRASSFASFFNDYGTHTLQGYPRSGQTLEEVRDLLLGELQKIKDGAFDDWMIEAVVNNLKLQEIRRYENPTFLARTYVNAFTQFQSWEDVVRRLDEYGEVTKEELVNFAGEFYKENYVVVFKRQGEATELVKVDNPGITPVQLNRDKESDFVKAFNEIESPELSPVFIDYDKAIGKTGLGNGIEVAYVKNEVNDLMQLNIIFDMGKDHSKMLELAVGYLDYLGTDEYSPEDLKKEFFKLGINYGVSTGDDRSYVYISGLQENLAGGLALLLHLWGNAVSDQETYDKYVEKIAKDREDNKANKGYIMWNGLMSYGQYGEDSRLRDIFTTEELKELNPEALVETVRQLRGYRHRIFYYGNDVDAAVAALEEKHQVEELMDYPEAREYTEKETGGKVYFVDYDMVQAEMLFLSKGDTFDAEKLAAARLFNTFFGSGLSSIVFQEIRESKSLAYSAFSSYRSAAELEKPDYIYAYVGTQANKIPDAVDAMMELMNDMPEAEEQFNNAKESTLKQIAAQRITKQNIFWSLEGLKKRGITHDNREDIYNTVKDMTLDDLRAFFDENIKDGDYTVMVIGNRDDVPMQALQTLGEVEELDVDYLFNYKEDEGPELAL